ncbi:MAG: DUF4143 domain-containing protein [Deltaproteobacteria bacterium]|nr:DUF4143 domain-containing protein [Deltaproteobacteria bacterium]
MIHSHHKNFRKRLLKTPKLYFADTGVLSFLLSIRTSDELKGHPQRIQIKCSFMA